MMGTPVGEITGVRVNMKGDVNAACKAANTTVAVEG